MPNESFAEMLHTPIPRVLVAVCTYKRPKMLMACLGSLMAQDHDFCYAPTIAVIDNDPALSARGIVNAAKEACPFPLRYISEPIRGIAKARNTALNYARLGDFSHIIFIDDDETASPDWLLGLMHPMWRDEPIVYGRRIFDYAGIPDWAKPKDNKPLLPNGAACKAFTHNVRISREVFSKLWFDESLGLGGGEDGDYFARARKAGYQAVFAARAITWERAHPERMSFWGQVNRAYWIGASSLRESATEKGIRYKYMKIASILASPFIALPIVLAGGLIWPVSRSRGLRLMLVGVKRCAKHQGRLAAIIGHIPQSYAKTVGA